MQRKKNRHQNVSFWKSDIKLYLIFASLRVILTLLPQTGYIHPDEFFQSIEVASGESFDIDVNKPWEYNVTFPVRSYFFPYVTVACPYYFLKTISLVAYHFFGISLRTPYFLIVFPRLFMTLLSFVCDYCLYKICTIFNQTWSEKMIIFSSSYVMLIYATRTFSNSLEMTFMSLLLYFVSRCMDLSNRVVTKSDVINEKYYTSQPGKDRAKYYKLRSSLPAHSLNDCLIIATITVLGIFNRLTFIAFALPPIFFWLYRGLGSRSIGFLDFHLRIFLLVLCGLPTLLFMIFYDSFYFGYLTMEEIWNLEVGFNNFVVTPYNFLRYNLKVDNLKTHGLHPWNTHCIINVPLLFNALGVVGLFKTFKTVSRAFQGRWLELPHLESAESLMIASIISPIALLSIVPHQEPRFIIPIILPLVFLYAPVIKPSAGVIVNRQRQRISIIVQSDRKNFLNLGRIWFICNIALIMFYGFIHQGGVLPVTSHLAQELRSKPYHSQIHLVTSHTYSLPTGLLHLKNTQRVYRNEANLKYKLTKDFHLRELGTKDVPSVYEEVINELDRCEQDFRAKNMSYRLYYVLPSSFFHEFADYSLKAETQAFKFSVIKDFYPHLSMEHLPLMNTIRGCMELGKLTECAEQFLENVSDNFKKYLYQFGLKIIKITKLRS